MEGIILAGCRENNLKNITLTIPYSKIVTFIGVSGSGKSSLVFDTLYAEGKRRYIESLGVNESYFLSKVKRPDADYFLGLPPSIALRQTGAVRSPRSMVGTISQAGYYLQLLFSCCGHDADGANRQWTASVFNVNSPSGMCPECSGEGEITQFDETLIWPDQRLSFAEEGLLLGGAKKGTTKYRFMESFLQQFGCSTSTPIRDYPRELKVALLFGQKKNRTYKVEYPGIIPTYETTYRTTKSLDVREELEKFMRKTACSCCGGTGHHPDSLQITIDGKNIAVFSRMSLEELQEFLEEYNFGDYRQPAFEAIREKFLAILKNCIDLGVGYLTMERKATTLSGGELQRLRMIAQISAEISGVVYVLDEPSSGMHLCDIDRLLRTIRRLNQSGNNNTVVLVEHTAQLILASDYIFEIGPGAGDSGGYIVAQGTPEEVCQNPCSISAKYLTYLETPGTLNRNSEFTFGRCVEILHASANNLNGVDVKIPLNCFVCVTGVSGSGKTSLIFDVLYQSLVYKRNIHLQQILGAENIDRVVLCDQSPIGISTRSCPATYSDAYTAIRKLFAQTGEARKRRFTEKHFSYNSADGRCKKCGGDGCLKLNMGFMPNMSIPCDVCNGMRFKKEVLEVKYRGRTIAEVLDSSVAQALEFFADVPSVAKKLQPLVDVGLGYLMLGQNTSTLSGGEAQRLKLAYELSRVHLGKALILFDEPSRGLHFEDVRCLLRVMKQLVEKGISVVAIEHNLDIVSTADYVIDIGPDAGAKGGSVCGTGTPLQISKLDSHTGKALRRYFCK